MGRKGLFLFLGLAALMQSGCTIYGVAAHNLAFEAGRSVDSFCTAAKHHHLASEAWHEVERTTAKGTFSKDYAKGFKEGYFDQLEHGGGVKQPPATPPECYWTKHYSTPTGYRAIEQWYAGYGHGLELAEGSGRAEFRKVPIWLSQPPESSEPGVYPASDPQGPAVEPLPAPRTVPPTPPRPPEPDPAIGQVIDRSALAPKWAR